MEENEAVGRGVKMKKMSFALLFVVVLLSGCAGRSAGDAAMDAAQIITDWIIDDAVTGGGDNMKKLKLDCGACKASEAMEATQVSRFPGFIRFIGYLIVTPSVIGILFGVLTLVSTGLVANDAPQFGQGDVGMAGTAIGVGLSLFIGLSSLIGGLIGWLLLMKKKVFRCVECGYILDRG